MWDSSGPVLSIGSQFMSADTSAAQSLVKTSAFADAIIDSELIVAYPGVGTDDRKGWEFNCNTAIAGDCNNWLIRSRIINQQNTGGVGALASSVASGTTGWSFRCLYSSIAKVGNGLVVNTTQLGSTKWDLFMRGCLFSDIADAIFQVTGDDLDTVNLDIQDMTYDDTGSNEWDMETANIDTLALARADILANSVGALCGGIACTSGRLDTYFFGNSGNLAGTLARGTVTDSVRLGSCHEDRAACFQATTYAIDEELDAALTLPSWALPSGERVRRWQLNAGGVVYNRGAP